VTLVIIKKVAELWRTGGAKETPTIRIGQIMLIAFEAAGA
jgi:hypothetical protein